MADIIVGEKVINKVGQIGTIVSFQDNCIHVEFNGRDVKFLENAFEAGFLKYTESDLQDKVNESVTQAKLEEERERLVKDKAQQDRLFIQKMTSKTNFRVAVTSASIRLDSAPVTFNSVRKKDQDLIQNIFAECDKETRVLFDSFNPKMEYLRRCSISNSRSKYCVGFLTKHFDTYVFRVFSRNDLYKHTLTDGVTVRHSDTTEVLRILRVNDRNYYFTKNVSFSRGYFTNSQAFNNWHISDVNSTILLNEVIRNCDCGYLNDFIAAKNIECLQYVKLLFPAFYNNKAEVVFKNKAFSSAYRIDDIESYLEGFSSKHIDYASKNDALNALPIIKQHGLIDQSILGNLETIMRKRKDGISVYHVLEKRLADLGLACEDLGTRLVGFLKKVDHFNVGVYHDYINELAVHPGVTIQDFFDKDYIGRHNILIRDKKVHVDEEQQRRYRQVAAELSWIDREENELFIIVPKTIAEFMYEGDVQHNCVYTNQYYNDVIARYSIIVFLRKEKCTPYVTVEFDYETFEVMQAYGKHNRAIDRDLFQYIVDLGKRLRCEMLSQQ